MTTTARHGASCPHVNLKERFQKLDIEVELGFTVEQGCRGSRALPELRYTNCVYRETVYRMRCLPGHLPGKLPHDYAEWRKASDSLAP